MVVPLSVGVVSSVAGCVCGPRLSSKPVMKGLGGGPVSIMARSASESWLTLLAASLALAVILWLPSSSSGVTKLHPPCSSAFAQPRLFPSPKISISLWASALPVIVRVVSLVVLSFGSPVSSSNRNITGLAGATVSMVRAKGSERSLTFPSSSAAVAVKL